MIIVGKYGWGEKSDKQSGIRALGFVAEKDLPAIYSLAFMFVYPSLYEGFGLPVLEAMACGCPVITSKRGSLKEIGGSSAVFVDPDVEDDLVVQMTKLFIDKELRKDLIKKGRKNALRFKWKNTAEKMLKLYDDVLLSTGGKVS